MSAVPRGAATAATKQLETLKKVAAKHSAPPARKRWEYRVDLYDPMGWLLEAWLNNHGANGWELVQRADRMFTFKREVV